MREPSTVPTVSERSESVKKVTLRTIFASTSTQYACQTLSTSFRPMWVVLAQLDSLLSPTAGFAMPMRLTAVTLCYKLYLVCYKPRDQENEKNSKSSKIILDIRFLFLLRIVIELEPSKKVPSN